ncbi:MAG: apolipoprotein N-acyltransferase [Gammaproteobacteria bacterium]|nr:apolipoprotein N-acyltransferase [Gammaproteobacteria bacterium]
MNPASSRGRGILLALAGGAALPLAFAPFGLYLLAPVCIAALFASWRGATPRQAMRRGYLSGLAVFGFGVHWVYVSMHDFGGMGAAMSTAVTALLVAVLAVFPALAAGLAARLSHREGREPAAVMVLVYPAAWTLFEWVRGWFLTGFPWLNLGYSQIDGPLAGFAPLVGVYGLSLAVALSGVLLLAAFERRAAPGLRAACLVALAGLWLGAALAGAIEWTRPEGRPLRVSLVQGNVSQDMKWQPGMLEPTVALYDGLTRAHWDSDLIVWPETAMPMYYLQAVPYLDELGKEARAQGAELLVGLIYLDPASGNYYNSMVSVGGGSGTPQVYHKHHLVPFTEYLPLKQALGGFVDLLDVPMSDFSAGPERQAPFEVAGQQVGMSICYEDAFGEEMIRMLPRATLLVNVSNDAWFGRSVAPFQHLQIARMRALETGRPLLRSTNTGISALIGYRGELLDTSPQFEVHVLSGEVQPRQGATPYVRVGNAGFLVLAGFMIAIGLLRARKVGLRA